MRRNVTEVAGIGIGFCGEQFAGGRGRPRNPAKDVAVLQATRDLLVEVGYQGTTVMAIARRAGVGAPTIYRRWPTKEALVEDATFGHPQPAPVPQPTGDLQTDLRAWVECSCTGLPTRQRGRRYRGC